MSSKIMMESILRLAKKYKIPEDMIVIFQKGFEEGYDEGFEDGRKDGYEEGYEESYDEGYKQGSDDTMEKKCHRYW